MGADSAISVTALFREYYTLHRHGVSCQKQLELGTGLRLRLGLGLACSCCDGGSVSSCCNRGAYYVFSYS